MLQQEINNLLVKIGRYILEFLTFANKTREDDVCLTNLTTPVSNPQYFIEKTTAEEVYTCLKVLLNDPKVCHDLAHGKIVQGQGHILNTTFISKSVLARGI